MQCGMYILNPLTATYSWGNSILGSTLTTCRAPAACVLTAQSATFGGTTLGAVTAADGTSNTILLSHKALAPSIYTATTPSIGDSYFGDVNSTNVYIFDHERLTWDFGNAGTSSPNYGTAMPPVQDGNTTTATAYTYGFGSAHPGAMPSVYADGSVRNFSYSASGTANGGTLTTGQVWQAIWSFNDGMALSGWEQ